MTGGTTADGVRIELYVRSLAGSDRSDQARAIDRLDALVADGEVEQYRVLVWGERAPPRPEGTRTAAGRFVLDRVSVFRRWAERNGVSVARPFAVRTVDSSITGECYDELVLPKLVLAEYRAGALSRVVPHERDGETVCVSEYLDRLQTGDLAETVPVERGPAAMRVAGGMGQSPTERPPPDGARNVDAGTVADADAGTAPDAEPTSGPDGPVDTDSESRRSREPRP